MRYQRFSLRTRDIIFDFLDCETETSKCFEGERKAFSVLKFEPQIQLRAMRMSKGALVQKSYKVAFCPKYFTGDNRLLLRLRGIHYELSWVVCGFLIPLLTLWPASACSEQAETKNSTNCITHYVLISQNKITVFLAPKRRCSKLVAFVEFRQFRRSLY